MGKLIDLTGQQFGRLTVLGRAGTSKHSDVHWLCKCVCGKSTVSAGKDLRSGHTKSCGCLQRDTVAYMNSKIKKTHGETVKRTPTRIYHIWRSMKARCYNPHHKSYKNYGGRGIAICDAWKNDFAAFRAWAMFHGYRDDLSIDRFDNDKGYSPDNCRWATAKEQAQNRRPPKRTLKTE